MRDDAKDFEPKNSSESSPELGIEGLARWVTKRKTFIVLSG
ncbi:hypothetical protein ACJ2PR_30945 [Phormidesmis sp. 146-33]